MKRSARLSHMLGRVDLERAGDLAAKAVLDHVGVRLDAGPPRAERPPRPPAAVFPMGETMPGGGSPVTTTRFM